MATKNRELHTDAAQLYFSYGYGFVEDKDPTRAALLYAEGLRLGRQALAHRGWFEPDLAPGTAPDPKRLAQIGRDDVPLLFWTLADWSGWINLSIDDPSAVAQLVAVEAYLGRVLELQPDYFLGMPHVLLGAMQCFRPVMFGGKPEEGRKHIEAALGISGNRMLLYHVFFAQYYCRQTLDEEQFRQSLETVRDAPADLLPEYQLFNLIAQRKATHLLEKIDELF
ncbi:MAG: TRAP transporter TatT component family protein [Candidatus Eisenbacteria bacterium]